MGNLCEDSGTFMIVSGSLVLRMTNVSNKGCIQNQKHILYSISLFRNHAFCETVWKNMDVLYRPQMII